MGRSRPTVSPSSAATCSARSSRSAPPRASQRSRASEYASSAPGGARDEGLGRLVHGALGVGDPGAAGQELGDGLAVAPLGLLREVADGGGGRGEPQLALLRAVESGEQAQQGGLARAVDSDETDHVSRGDDEVEPGEERAVAVSGGKVLGDESGSHQGADSKGCPAPGSPAARPPRPMAAPGREDAVRAVS